MRVLLTYLCVLGHHDLCDETYRYCECSCHSHHDSDLDVAEMIGRTDLLPSDDDD